MRSQGNFLMNGRLTIWMAAASIALVTAGSAGAQQSAVPLAVLVQPAEARPLAAQREFIGRAQALDKVDLRARVQGFLGPRKFKDGDLIKAGQLLFLIEPEPYEAAVEQREGQKAAATGAVANAEVQFRRAQELARTNVGTQQTLDQRTAELIAAKGALTEADASLKDAKIKLSYTEVRSPIAGRVGRASVPPGNVVGPESGVLATVVAEQPMLVVFSVTQRELLEARRGGASGEAIVTGGQNIFARLIAKVMRFPKAGSCALHVSFAETDGVERWTRSFGDQSFTSHLSERDGCLVERFGALRFRFDLPSDERGLEMRIRGWSLFGLSLPLALAPQGVAREWQENGRFRFDVPIALPLVGLVVHYTGWLEVK